MKKVHISLIAGARPNFMKVAPIVHALSARKEEAQKAGVDLVISIVHTGQHYDKNMSDIFFRHLGILKLDRHLEVGSGSHVGQTARIMVSFEKVLLEDRPDLVVVVGDVNSTIACSLTAKKMGIKVAHIKAGLRSFDMGMPEEINRKLTDAISDFLFVTEESGVRNLQAEGVSGDKIFLVGNVMIDTLLRNLAQIESEEFAPPATVQGFCGTGKRYAVLTLHRPSNVDSRDALAPPSGGRSTRSRAGSPSCSPSTRGRERKLQSLGWTERADNGRPRRVSGNAVCGERSSDGFDRLGRFAGGDDGARCAVRHHP